MLYIATALCLFLVLLEAGFYVVFVDSFRGDTLPEDGAFSKMTFTTPRAGPDVPYTGLLLRAIESLRRGFRVSVLVL